MGYRLLALDLDGTLLDAGSRIPPAHREAVVQARAKGLEVVIVTGRSWHEMDRFYQELGLTTPAITLLGAQVVDGQGRPILERRMEAAAAVALAQVADDRGWSLSVVFDSGVVRSNGRPPDYTPWEQWNPFTRVGGPLAPAVAARPPLHMCAYGKAACDGFLAAFAGGLPATQWNLDAPAPDAVALFFWHEAVNKGAALAAFCAERGFHPSEVVAMGDNAIDLPMLRWAGTGVAMAAAPPHVQAECALVADPGDPQPVATALRRLGILP